MRPGTETLVDGRLQGHFNKALLDQGWRTFRSWPRPDPRQAAGPITWFLRCAQSAHQVLSCALRAHS